jgi:NAD(P)H-flavin reductase
VAEEIGIVPIRAIVADLHETGDRRPLTLVYWARDPGWLVCDAELRALSRSHPGFAYHPVAGGASGAGVEAAAGVDRLVTDTNGLVAYVAGGEATINRVREVLMAKGLERKAVKWEKFW